MLFDSCYHARQLCDTDCMSRIIRLCYWCKTVSYFSCYVRIFLLKAWSIPVFVLIWWCKHDRVIKVDTDFEICLWTLSLPSDIIAITFVVSLSLEWCFICNLLDLFHLHLHDKEAASLLINTEHCVCNHCHGPEKKNCFQIQMWQMASRVSVDTRCEPDTCRSLIFSFVFCVCVINSH